MNQFLSFPAIWDSFSVKVDSSPVHLKMHIVAFITGALGLCSAVVASNLEARQLAPVPSLTHLYSLNCTLDPKIDVGDGPYGKRVAIPIIGGTFEGPRLKGKSNMGAMVSSDPYTPRCFFFLFFFSSTGVSHKHVQVPSATSEQTGV